MIGAQHLASEKLYKIGFVIEQALGHVTHGQNLRRNIANDPELEAFWVFPKWEASGVAGFMPNWTMKAGLQTRQAVAALERNAQLDALFFHTQVTAVLSQKWLKRIPSVVSLDATPLQYDSLGKAYDHSSGPRWVEQGKWKLNRDTFHLARHIISWSHWAKAGLSEYEVMSDKVTVIPPGVDLSAWTFPEPRQNQTQPVKILFVGANLQRKGGEILLEAFRRLREPISAPISTAKSVKPVELHLVTRTQVPPEEGVFVYDNMQPNSDELKQLYFDCDIFCLPTMGDCLPMVLAEAGAAGLPLVSTNIAAIPEIVKDDQSGFLIEPGDVDGLTTVLQRLVDHPHLRLQLGEQAAQLIRSEHDAEQNAKRLLDLLKSQTFMS